jgi:hypothetical protein
MPCTGCGCRFSGVSCEFAVDGAKKQEAISRNANSALQRKQVLRMIIVDHAVKNSKGAYGNSALASYKAQTRKITNIEISRTL